MAGVFYYVIPYFSHVVNPPIQQYSQTLHFKTNVNHLFNETFYTGNYAGTLSVYDLNFNLLETIAYSSGFTSVNYYTSGQVLRFKLTGTANGVGTGTLPLQTVSGILSIPYYASDQNPAGYHVLPNIAVLYNPAPVCTFSLNGAYNTTSHVIFDISDNGAGSTITCSLEFYNTRDESGLRSWVDASYQYNPLVLIEDEYLNATCKPLLMHINGLQCVRVETASASGLYVAHPADAALDRNKNQAVGNLITNNRITITFSIDVTQITGSNVGMLRFTLYDSIDPSYFATYGTGQTGAETLLSVSTFSVYIRA